MQKTIETQSDEKFDPRGSIFFPKTEYPLREFGDWGAAIYMRRGSLFPGVTSATVTLERQQELHEELTRVRDWYMGQLAAELSGV